MYISDFPVFSQEFSAIYQMFGYGLSRRSCGYGSTQTASHPKESNKHSRVLPPRRTTRFLSTVVRKSHHKSQSIKYVMFLIICYLVQLYSRAQESSRSLREIIDTFSRKFGRYITLLGNLRCFCCRRRIIVRNWIRSRWFGDSKGFC
jgi:hypothetical protein